MQKADEMLLVLVVSELENVQIAGIRLDGTQWCNLLASQEPHLSSRVYAERRKRSLVATNRRSMN